MTISSENVQNTYSGNDSTTVFAYSFKITDEDHLSVIIADADDTQTTLTITTYYTVSGVGNDGGGNVTLLDLTTYCGQATLPTGWTLAITRDVPLLQSTDFENQGGFFADNHEDAFDKLTMISQQLQEQIDRCPKVTETSGQTGDDYLTTIETAVSNASASASAAAASETAAAASETAAAASETAAATSETNAATSETNAAASASAASTSETNAATSETNAASSASAASTSATNAATSETNAGTSETNAAASAAAASTSETNAATSETNAASSASAASTSETNAATSETNAAASATAAAASAAGVNLESISAGDAGKVMRVNAAEDGHELTDVKITADDIIDMPETTTPSTPSAGRRLIYPKSDDGIYHLTDGGSELELADISSAQQFTGKDYDGGTASNTSRLTLPSNTTANLNGLTRKEGTIAYDSTLNRMVYDDGSNLYKLTGRTLYAAGGNTAGTSFPTSGSFVTIGWTELYDSDNAFGSSTFTAPYDMILNIAGLVGVVDPTANTVITAIDIAFICSDGNYDITSRFPVPSPSDNTIFSVPFAHTVQLDSGDTIYFSVRLYFTGTGTTPSLYTGSGYNKIFFTGYEL